MMGELTFAPEWITSERGPQEVRKTAALLRIVIGDRTVTTVEDELSRSVRTQVCVSAYPLALWFASNWWRLNWEAPPDWSRSLDWRMAHEMGAAGHGYLWPNLVFEPDGEALDIHCRRTQMSPTEPLRYLEEFGKRVSLDVFARSVGEFVAAVLGRLDAVGVSDAELAEIWRRLDEERLDREITASRKLEARLGFDPGEAPEATMDGFRKLAARAGEAATNEIAPACAGRDSVRVLQDIFQWIQSRGVAACFATPSLLTHEVAKLGLDGTATWERGWQLARVARSAWDLREGPISDKTLGDLIGVAPTVLMPDAACPAGGPPLGLVVRDGHPVKASLFFRKTRNEARRFEAARFVVDNILAPAQDRWLPVTDAKTARQKVQRAFAIEFLCPIAELKERLGGDFSDTAIEDIAGAYGVSALAVESHLANNGLLPRF